MHEEKGDNGVRKTDLEEFSSEEVEVRAIGDVVDGKGSNSSSDEAGTEQAVEYDEKRELTVDERENVEPMRH
jgi:hypothetical protein